MDLRVNHLVVAAFSVTLVAVSVTSTPAQTTTDQPAGAIGVVRGRVLTEGDGVPIPRARITVDGFNGSGSTLTDLDGRFELRVPPGFHRLFASKAGFVATNHREGPGLRANGSIQVDPGQVIEDIAIALHRAGAIAGRVVDDRGEPVVDGLVHLLRQEFVGGRRQPVSGFGSDRTDDRGEFRIHSIVPGTYMLAATIAPTTGSVPNSLLSDPPTYYPGTLSAEAAQPLNIEPGDIRTGLVLTAIPATLATVSGSVEVPGEAAEPISVSLLHRPVLSASGNSSRSMTARPDGTFSFSNVAPGAYTVWARQHSDRPNAALAHILLEGSDVNVPLTLRRGDTARGRVIVESDPTRTRSLTMPPWLVFDAARPQELVPTTIVRVQDDGTFEARDLLGKRSIKLTLPDGWTVKAVRIDNADVTDTPFEFNGSDINGIDIVVTNRITDVSGTVVDAEGNLVPGATVVIFPEDRSRWTPESRFIAAVRSDANGRFASRALLPARYLAVAVSTFEPGAETSAEVLQSLVGPAVTRFELEEGEAFALELRLPAGR